MTHAPLWLSRPLLNVADIYQWGEAAGIKKMMPPEQLHMTVATVREPVSWESLEIRDDELIIPAGHKIVQIFGYTIKALTFGDPRVKQRHEEILARYPQMDYPLLRPHISLFKGGRMPRVEYEGKLVLGPEKLEKFDAAYANAKGVKHIKIADYLDARGLR